MISICLFLAFLVLPVYSADSDLFPEPVFLPNRAEGVDIPAEYNPYNLSPCEQVLFSLTIKTDLLTDHFATLPQPGRVDYYATDTEEDSLLRSTWYTDIPHMDAVISHSGDSSGGSLFRYNEQRKLVANGLYTRIKEDVFAQLPVNGFGQMFGTDPADGIIGGNKTGYKWKYTTPAEGEENLQEIWKSESSIGSNNAQKTFSVQRDSSHLLKRITLDGNSESRNPALHTITNSTGNYWITPNTAEHTYAVNIAIATHYIRTSNGEEERVLENSYIQERFTLHQGIIVARHTLEYDTETDRWNEIRRIEHEFSRSGDTLIHLREYTENASTSIQVEKKLYDEQDRLVECIQEGSRQVYTYGDSEDPVSGIGGDFSEPQVQTHISGRTARFILPHTERNADISVYSPRGQRVFQGGGKNLHFTADSPGIYVYTIHRHGRIQSGTLRIR
jgi:hypothetical protein